MGAVPNFRVSIQRLQAARDQLRAFVPSDNLEAPESITFDDIDDAELECVREGISRSG